VSAATASDLEEHLGINRRRIHVIHEGLDPVFCVSADATPRPADLPDRYLLFVSTLEPRKNLERILIAYDRFRSGRSAAGRPVPGLWLVGGRGWKDSGLRQRLEALVAAGAVHVEDYCDTDRLWELYGLARALLFPSLHEGFGFPILEAMAANLPVLTANVGAMAEVAGDAALLVDPCETTALVDAMTRLADDSDLRADLAARGRERVAVWDWERTAAATLDVYAEVLTRSRPGTRSI